MKVNKKSADILVKGFIGGKVAGPACSLYRLSPPPFSIPPPPPPRILKPFTMHTYVVIWYLLYSVQCTIQ
jgi:hypothetical protein